MHDVHGSGLGRFRSEAERFDLRNNIVVRGDGASGSADEGKTPLLIFREQGFSGLLDFFRVPEALKDREDLAAYRAYLRSYRKRG